MTFKRRRLLRIYHKSASQTRTFITWWQCRTLTVHMCGHSRCPSPGTDVYLAHGLDLLFNIERGKKIPLNKFGETRRTCSGRLMQLNGC